MVEKDVYRRFVSSPEYKEMKTSADPSIMLNTRKRMSFSTFQRFENFAELDEIRDNSVAHFLKIEPRRRRLAISGAELVDWLVHTHRAANRTAGVCIGQRLVEANLFESQHRASANNVDFRDNNSKYNIVQIEQQKNFPELKQLISASAKEKIIVTDALKKGIFYQQLLLVKTTLNLFIYRQGKTNVQHSSLRMNTPFAAVIHVLGDHMDESLSATRRRIFAYSDAETKALSDFLDRQTARIYFSLRYQNHSHVFLFNNVNKSSALIRSVVAHSRSFSCVIHPDPEAVTKSMDENMRRSIPGSRASALGL
jgi:hypothetical protein